MNTLERALRYAEEHRTIHTEWVQYWRENPPKTHDDRVVRSAVGGIKHHQWAITRYNTIIKALKGAA